MTRPNPTEPTGSGQPATRAVFDTLLEEIVKGTYEPGSRLPSERDLATSLSASRPTVREALRRLSAWGLVVAKRGSGIVVRPVREWSLEVVPAYLRFGKPAEDEPSIGQTIRDILSIRKMLLCDLSRIVAARLDTDAVIAARECLEAAWEARGTPEFVWKDFEIFRSLAESAKFLPALWLLNGIGNVYVDVASSMSTAIGPPDFYLESYHRYFGALQRRDGGAASKALADYFDRHDERFIAMLPGTR